jgi:hypothetical protein
VAPFSFSDLVKQQAEKQIPCSARDDSTEAEDLIAISDGAVLAA